MREEVFLQRFYIDTSVIVLSHLDDIELFLEKNQFGIFAVLGMRESVGNPILLDNEKDSAKLPRRTLLC